MKSRLDWFRAHDPDLSALRRSARAAIAFPLLFAIGFKVLHSADFALFAGLGSFAMLLLIEFRGAARDRVRSQVALTCVCLVLVCVGTLASQNPWIAAATTLVVIFSIVFSGVISSEFVAGTPAMLFAFVLPVTLKANASAIPDRALGWLVASLVSLPAIAFMWPAPVRNPLRALTVEACRAFAARLRADIAFRLDGQTAELQQAREQAANHVDASVAALNAAFLKTPYRPSGLAASTRSLVQLIDEINWLKSMTSTSTQHKVIPFDQASCAVKKSCAQVLEDSANLLVKDGSIQPLRNAVAELRERVGDLEQYATSDLPVQRLRSESGEVTEFVTSLDPSFRAQELAYAVTQVAHSVELGIAEEERTWADRLLGRQPAGLANNLSTAGARIASHLEPHSVWLHNSLRSSTGLALAVLIATATGVQHSFWVVLGTLAVLRTNAFNTGQNALRAMLGTAVGFAIGSIILIPIGDHTDVLWALLPFTVLLAGVIPAAVSFAAGQAAFTVNLLIVFNIVAPAGWRVGLIRVEDVALGCAISLVVGTLFWPRGAAAALGRALGEAYAGSAKYVDASVTFALGKCGTKLHAPLPTNEHQQADAAIRRLDDAFRTYLSERGAKPVPLSELTTLVSGAVGLRSAGDAVVDLWNDHDGRADGDRSTARAELFETKKQVLNWYEDFAAKLVAVSEPNSAVDHDKQADRRLIDAVRHDLTQNDGSATSTAVRVIWTADHLDALRNLQTTLIEPIRAAARTGAFASR